MKFSISSDRLKEALAKVSSVVPSKTTLPILQDILFELKGNMLRLTATDLEISVMMNVSPVDGEKDGAIAIPGAKFADIVKALPDGLLLMVETLDSNRAVITTNKGGEYKMSAEPADSFPAIPEFLDSNSISIGVDILDELIEGTIFAVSKEELRPALMGVLLQFKENELIAVATDGHRLVKIARKGINPQNFVGKEVIVPAKTLQIINKAFEEGEDCKIAINEKHIQFTSSDITIISRLIDEKYPNYESVIPYDNNQELVVERDILISSVKRVSIFASSTTNQIRFRLDPKGELQVSAEDIDFGGEAREVLECEYRGKAMEIGFNAKYIIDLVGHLDSDRVIFKFSTPERAVIVQPAESSSDREILMLVMPMRLHS